LGSRRIESALTGAIYDPYVRWIAWEGILGWWKDEWVEWMTCPTQPDRAGYPFFPQPANQFAVIPATDLHPDPHISALQGAPLDPAFPLCPYDWARPIHDSLHCSTTSTSTINALFTPSNMSYIWPPHLSTVEPNAPPHHYPAAELTELNTNWYTGRLRDEQVVEKVLAMAGVRLAAILNEILDPSADEGVRVSWA
jgi:hypothetical protein